MQLPKCVPFLSLVIIVCCPALSEVQGLEENFDIRVFKVYKVPFDRDEVVRWHLQLCELKLEGMPRRKIESLANICLSAAANSLELQDSRKALLGDESLESLSDENLKNVLIQTEKATIAKLSTEEIRTKVQLEIYHRDQIERSFQDRLAGIAEQLAQLANESKGTDVEARARAALKESGYVDLQGKVLPRDVAIPPLGIGR